MRFKAIINWLDSEQYRYKYDDPNTLWVYPTDSLSIRIEPSLRHNSKLRVTRLPSATMEYSTQKEAMVAMMKMIRDDKEYTALHVASEDTHFYGALLSMADQANATLTPIHTLLALKRGFAYFNIKNAHHDINVKYRFIEGGAILDTQREWEDEASVLAQLSSRLLTD